MSFSSPSTPLTLSPNGVALPGGAVLEVWADGPRARVAYADGRVLSLTSDVPLISAAASEAFVGVHANLLAADMSQPAADLLGLPRVVEELAPPS